MGKGFKESTRLRPAVDHPRRRVHIDIAGAARGDDRIAYHHKGQPAHAEGNGDIAIRQRKLFAHLGPTAVQHFGGDTAKERQLQQHVDNRRQHH